MLFKTVAGPGVAGLHPADVVVTAKASEALTRGDVCMFDFSFNTGTTDNDPGESASPYYLVRDPDANGTAPLNHLSQGIFGVAMEDIAAAGTGKIMVSGHCPYLTVANSTAAGSRMCAAASGTGLTASTGLLKTKIVAITTQANSSGGATGVTALFDGVHGFGTDTSGLTAP